MTKHLLYVGDPMCSWCWGFAPTKRRIEAQCEGRAEVSLIVGGLRPFTTEPQDDERKTFLREHWQEIGEKTGQPFAFHLLDRDDFVYDTEPPSRAAVVVRHLEGQRRALDFFSELQRAFYADNADVTQAETLTKLARNFGVDADAFAAKFETEEMRQATIEDFQMARSLGVTGFPTVVVKDDEGYAYLTVGYQPYEHLERLLGAWLDGNVERRVPQPTQ
jgi:putative protein-disulfide isomerase